MDTFNRSGVPKEEPIEYIRSTQPFIFRRRVLWGECDPAGVVYTPRFVDFASIASQHFLGHLLGAGFTESKRSNNFGTPCKALSLIFHSSLRPDQIFDMNVYVKTIGTTTFTLGIAGTASDGTSIFDATFTVITVQPSDRSAIVVPTQLRNALKPYVRDSQSQDQ